MGGHRLKKLQRSRQIVSKPRPVNNLRPSSGGNQKMYPGTRQRLATSKSKTDIADLDQARKLTGRQEAIRKQ